MRCANTTDLHFKYVIKFNRDIDWFDIGPLLMHKFKQFIFTRDYGFWGGDKNMLELTNGLNVGVYKITMHKGPYADDAFEPYYLNNDEHFYMTQEDIGELMPLYDKYWALNNSGILCEMHTLIVQYLQKQQIAPESLEDEKELLYKSVANILHILKNNLYYDIIQKAIELKMIHIPHQEEMVEYVKEWCKTQDGLEIVSHGWTDTFQTVFSRLPMSDKDTALWDALLSIAPNIA